MRTRTVHKWLGLVMLTPLTTWAMTGLIFFIKPGYEGAYEQLPIKTYEIEHDIHVANTTALTSITALQSIIGLHILAKSDGRNIQLDPASMKLRTQPSESEIRALINDAVAQNDQRYGKIKSLDGTTAMTENNIKIELNWDTLTLRQYGPDRKLIELMYKIHYLQWTPWPLPNQILGVIGLLFLVTLSFLGLRMFLRK